MRSWGDWKETSDGLQVRRYRSYSDYVKHQGSKLKWKDLSEYEVRFRTALRQRLEHVGATHPGMSVLCLAARIGTEVRAFHDLGCFAVGIDLNPGKGNRLVVTGDFHELQFPDSSVDLIYTNSLDHALDLGRVIQEVVRVAKPHGELIVEATRGRNEGQEFGRYESFSWSSIQELVRVLEGSGFALRGTLEFDYPWPGEMLRLAVPGSG